MECWHHRQGLYWTCQGTNLLCLYTELEADWAVEGTELAVGMGFQQTGSWAHRSPAQGRTLPRVPHGAPVQAGPDITWVRSPGGAPRAFSQMGCRTVWSLGHQHLGQEPLPLQFTGEEGEAQGLATGLVTDELLRLLQTADMGSKGLPRTCWGWEAAGTRVLTGQCGTQRGSWCCLWSLFGLGAVSTISWEGASPRTPLLCPVKKSGTSQRGQGSCLPLCPALSKAAAERALGRQG